MTRREAIALGGGLVVAGALPARALSKKPPLAKGGAFAQGVAAGQPEQRGITLWTRLAEVERTSIVSWEVARDPGFSKVVLNGRANAKEHRDFTAHVRLSNARGLKAGEQYYYRFHTRDKDSPVGRFRTLRPPDSREPVRIGFFSCQRWEHGYFTPQAALAKEDLDLVVSLGDYLYEEDAGAKIPAREQHTADPNGHVETLEQWRAKWRLYRTDASLQAMHAAHPFIAIWDDCEVEGNWAGDGPSSGPSPVGPRAIPFAAKQRNAFKAFFENMPLRPVGTQPHRIYRQLRLGANAELFLLDTRQYRDPQPCGDASLGDDRLVTCTEYSEPGRTFLGSAQKRWLLDAVPASQARWKVLGNAQMLMALDLPTGKPVQMDPWDGYDAERREVLGALSSKGVRDLVSIVGDVHTFFAGDVTTTGRAGGRALGTEFVGSSISHDGLGIDGIPQDQFDQQASNVLPAQNVHLKYAKFGVRGYGVLELSDKQAEARFQAVRSVLEPTSDAYTLARFRVAAGDPHVRKV